MANTAADGRLRDVLSELRAEGMSYERIATELAIRYGFFISGMSVQRWLTDLDGAA